MTITASRRALAACLAAVAMAITAAPAYAWDDDSAVQAPVHAGVWAAPTVTLTAATNQRADASWPSLGEAITYTAQQRVNGGAWTPLVDQASANTVVAIAPGGSKVDVRVAGQVDGQPGPFGEASTVLPIYAPKELGLSFSAPTVARASWAGTSGATRYRLEYALDGGAWQLGRYDQNGWNEWTVHPGQQVAVRVQADNGSVYSPWTETVTARSPYGSTHAPIGTIDSATRSGSNITLTGWGLDEDGTDPLALHVYVVAGTDSSNIIQRGIGYQVRADRPRPDVAAVYPGLGTDLGYTATIPAPANPSTVCVFLMDKTSGVANNPLLACRTL
jgi:hypothetical protein